MIFLCISSVNALDNENLTLSSDESSDMPVSNSEEPILKSNEISVNTSSDFVKELSNAQNGDTIIIEKGTYNLSNIMITKDINLQGNGDPRDIIIDGEQKGSIFLIRSDAVHASFKNITFINANVSGFGGAISMETGHVYVDNCQFINNTASVNAGGISNYGTADQKGYLFVNNSLFVNNYAGHDGGAITTCYANSDIYNCVFISNSAHRDGGAIRVSVEGYGNVQDCIFMYNHADEWGGAYYSWSGTSNIDRCIFLNNTAGTNGGAIMVSGDIDISNSIIVNNSGGETGGSFYIQQPMYNARTVINVHDNLITNNTSPYGKEIYIYWKDTAHLYTKFDNNDWGDEDPNNRSVIDPDEITERSKVKTTIKSNLLNILNLDLLNRYSDLIGEYFPENYFNKINDKATDENGKNNHENDTNSRNSNIMTSDNIDNPNNIINNIIKNNNSNENQNNNLATESQSMTSENNNQIAGNSTSHGEEDKAYELNKKESNSIFKQTNFNITVFIIALIIICILLAIGYKRYEKEE